MDPNNPNDLYNANLTAAQRYAQMLRQEKEQKETAKQQKPAASQKSSKRNLYIGATFDAERADRIAAIWIPLLREIFPESFNEESKKKDFFRRIFKTPNTYLSREWVRNLYKALKNFNWNYLTSEKFGLSPKEKEILSNSDSKRHRFMEIIKETTNISDS